jgi:hypothetical protein
MEANEYDLVGTYTRKTPAAGQPSVNAQEELLQRRSSSNGRR